MQSQVRENVHLTQGRVIVRGRLLSRGKAKFADYVLSYRPNLPLAIVEAKDNNHGVGDGLQQALGYAEMLDVPFVFSSNGDGFIEHDRTGKAKRPERSLRLDQFPSPEELWRRYLEARGLENTAENVVAQDYCSDRSGKSPRYSEHQALPHPRQRGRSVRGLRAGLAGPDHVAVASGANTGLSDTEAAEA